MFEKTHLKCINESCQHVADLLSERRFKCPDCGDLYDVIHQIPKHSAKYWQNLFDAAVFNRNIPSPLWRFKPWIMPELKDGDIISLGEGSVPIIRAGKQITDWLGCDLELHLMLEGQGITGAFKDFGATVLISVARIAGALTVICVSTGDTSAAIAAYCARAGLKCIVILPLGRVTKAQIAQARLYGAKVILVPGTFDDCKNNVFKPLVEEYGAYPGNSVQPARIEGHQASVFLMAQHLRWQLPDWIVVPVGNGSNASSVGKALRLMKDQGFAINTRILGCQSAGANPLTVSWVAAGGRGISREQWEKYYRPAAVRRSKASAQNIGDPTSFRKVIREVVTSDGAMTQATEQEIFEAGLVLLSEGIDVCPQTAVALVGLKKAVKAGWVKGSAGLISTAAGWKFRGAFGNGSGQIVQVDWCDVREVLRHCN